LQIQQIPDLRRQLGQANASATTLEIFQIRQFANLGWQFRQMLEKKFEDLQIQQIPDLRRQLGQPI
jgi:hypothetical protein